TGVNPGFPMAKLWPQAVARYHFSHAANSGIEEKTVRPVLPPGLTLRCWFWPGRVGLCQTVRSLADEAGPSGGFEFWPGEIMHPSLSLRRSQSARMVRYEAGRAGGDLRRAQADSLAAARCGCLRVPASFGTGDGSRHGCPVNDASLPNSWRCLCSD